MSSVSRTIPRPLLLLTLAAGLAFASGCKRSPAATDAGAAAPEPARAADSGSGLSTASAALPARIVSIAPDATEIIASLGAADRLVGVCEFCVYPPDVVAGLPRVGGLFNPDLEKIAGLRPDLLVLRGRSAAVERLCADLNIRLYRDPAESIIDIYTTLEDLGRLLGRPDQARQLSAQMAARLDRLAERVRGRPRPRVLFTVARLTPDSVADVTTASRGTFIHEMIELAGGENVFADLSAAYPKVSPEAVLAARPEVIVEAMPESDDDPALHGQIVRLWRELGPLPAVESGRVHVLTDDNAQIPSPRIVGIIEHLARLFHPDVKFD